MPENERIAVVTGANRGIGLEVARQLADRGFDVVIGARDGAKGRAAADRIFGLLPEGAFVVNAGRGATLDEGALLTALRAGHLGGAALDVFETEPLPVTSPLWDEPNVLVSPHGAGGRPIGSGDLIAENVRHFLAGEPLRNLVTR